MRRLSASPTGGVDMQLLEHYVADGILGRAASGRLQELYKLGVSFLSDDAAVISSLP